MWATARCRKFPMGADRGAGAPVVVMHWLTLAFDRAADEGAFRAAHQRLQGAVVARVQLEAPRGAAA